MVLGNGNCGGVAALATDIELLDDVLADGGVVVAVLGAAAILRQAGSAAASIRISKIAAIIATPNLLPS